MNGGRSGFSPTTLVSIAVGVVLVALLGVLVVGIGEDETSLVGEPAPLVSGLAIDGRDYNSDDARGKWVVVNFFATWCPGCINEHPDLIEIDRWANETGQAEVIAVVFNDSPDRVADYFEAEGGDWPVLVSPQTANDFGVTNIPETFVISPSGTVALHIQGEVDAALLIDELERSLI